MEAKVSKGADALEIRIFKIIDGRKDLGPKVNELLQADPSLDPIDAAVMVREQVITPTIQATAQQKVADEQKRKALGNTVNLASRVLGVF